MRSAPSSSVRLLMALGDLRPMIAARPCGEHAVNLMPQYPGHVPAGAVAVA